MTDAPGIAGSRTPEVMGVFLCVDRSEADFFVRMNNTGGPVDVWQVDGIEVEQLLDAGSGFLYLPLPVPETSLRLTAPGAWATGSPRASEPGPSESMSSELTITFDHEQREPGQP